jgi:hypothetical protein
MPTGFGEVKLSKAINTALAKYDAGKSPRQVLSHLRAEYEPVKAECERRTGLGPEALCEEITAGNENRAILKSILLSVLYTNSPHNARR